MKSKTGKIQLVNAFFVNKSLKYVFVLNCTTTLHMCRMHVHCKIAVHENAELGSCNGRENRTAAVNVSQSFNSRKTTHQLSNADSNYRQCGGEPCTAGIAVF